MFHFVCEVQAQEQSCDREPQVQDPGARRQARGARAREKGATVSGKD